MRFSRRSVGAVTAAALLVTGVAVAAGAATRTTAGETVQSAADSAAQATGCTTSAAQGNCGPYLYRANTGSNGHNTYVGQDVWSPVNGWSQTLHSYTPGDWNVTAKLPAGIQQVVSFPNTSQQYNSRPLNDFGSMYSTFSENLRVDPNKGSVGEAGYDIWLNHWADEVMIQTDFIGDNLRGRCDTDHKVITTVRFGGTNGVPAENWNLCQFKSELIWQPRTGTNFPSGKVNVLAMLQWLENHGNGRYLPKNPKLIAVSYGFELCSTGGKEETFKVSSFANTYTLVKGLSRSPAVTTQGVSGVSSSVATLRGSVNPEAAATAYHFQYGTTKSYGLNAPVPNASAGYGTTAVTETYRLSGLAANTLYHYRLVATNATGTTYGADHTFTTAASGVGAVSYNATGPGSGGRGCAKCRTLTWHHTVSGNDAALVAAVAVGITNDRGCSLTLKDNGKAMARLALVHDDSQHGGYLEVFGLAKAPNGNNTLAASVTKCAYGAAPLEITAGSESFDGVNQNAPFGTVAVADGIGTAASVMLTSAANGMVAGFAANGSPVLAAASPAVSAYIANGTSTSAAGNSAGATSVGTGASVTMKWRLKSDEWGAVAVEINA